MSDRTAASVPRGGAATEHADTPKRFDFCNREGADAVRDIFCVPSPPTVGSLRALEDLIRVNPRPREGDAAVPAGAAVDPYSVVSVATFLAHSTALSGNLVSPINPRAILFGRYTIMAFQRGVQRVELASRAVESGPFKFYLVSFRQACNDEPEGCSPGDLYTPRIETDWTQVLVQDDEDLKNTTLDCRQCHQRGRETPSLLMRELESPWTHFFEPDPDQGVPAEFPGVRGRDLVLDYLRAKGDEPYADVPTATLRNTSGLILETFVESEGQPQLLFDARTIENERWPYGADGTWPATPLRSALWDTAYQAFKRGEQLALPSFEPRPTDPRKQSRLTDAYARYRSGALPAAELPDLADIFPDDAQLRAELGLQTEPGATPAQALIQACGSCHNAVLDQSISRALFNVDLSRMSRAELDVAIDRMLLPRGADRRMPPVESRQLDDAARSALIVYLRQDTRTKEDEALLKRAAQLGMASTHPMGVSY